MAQEFSYFKVGDDIKELVEVVEETKKFMSFANKALAARFDAQGVFLERDDEKQLLNIGSFAFDSKEDVKDSLKAVLVMVYPYNLCLGTRRTACAVRSMLITRHISLCCFRGSHSLRKSCFQMLLYIRPFPVKTVIIQISTGLCFQCSDELPYISFC